MEFIKEYKIILNKKQIEYIIDDLFMDLQTIKKIRFENKERFDNNETLLSKQNQKLWLQNNNKDIVFIKRIMNILEEKIYDKK